jgi:hypothetical protein
LTVNPAALTVTADAKTVTYGTVPSYTFTPTGLQNGETIGSVSYATNATTSTSGNQNAGSWTITPSAATGGTFSASNYSISYATGALTVNQKAAMLSGITASDKVYDGFATATVSVAGATFTGKVAGDTLTVSSTGVFSDKNVGVGKTVTLANVLGGADLGNYTITDQATTTASITPKPASVTPNSGTKVYGASDPALTGTLSGFLAGDSVTASYSRVAGETVAGGPYTISATLAPAGVLGNYTITYNTSNFTITAKPITVTADAGQTKVYGSADPVFTYTNTPLVGGDSFSGALSRVAGETVAGGPYSITQGTLTAGGNYTISYVSSNFSITPKSLTIGGSFTADNKVYDGNTSATIATNSLTITGVLGGDAVTLNPVAAFADKDVATGIIVSLTGSSTLGGAQAGNYIISLVGAPTTTANITSSVNPNPPTPEPNPPTPEPGQEPIYRPPEFNPPIEPWGPPVAIAFPILTPEGPVMVPIGIVSVGVIRGAFEDIMGDAIFLFGSGMELFGGVYGEVYFSEPSGSEAA